MENFYLVHRFNINATTGVEQHSTQKFVDIIQAKKRYYNILAADIDNGNFSYEMVQVVRNDGILILSQVFDNRTAEVEESNPAE